MKNIEYSPLIKKNIDFIKENGYVIYDNGTQVYKDFGNYEVLISDFSFKSFKISLFYNINILVWIKDSHTDVIVKKKQYLGNLFFPKFEKINRFVEKSIASLENQ